MLRTAGADVLDDELPVGLADTAFTGDGALADPGLATALDGVLDRLLQRSCALAGAG